MRLCLEEAIIYQIKRESELILTPPICELKMICGVDAAFGNNKIYASACLVELDKSSVGLINQTPTIIEEEEVIQNISYPYIPGFFALREGPALISVINKLKKKPDVILVDGHGIAHPRGFGLASHIGYLLKIPTVGCAKTCLVGEYEEPEIESGSFTPLIFNKKRVGAVLRTKKRVKPIFVSPGNLIDLDTAIKVVLSVSNYRIPEPLRIANIRSKELRDKKL